MASKKQRSKVRAYVFSADGNIKLAVVARSKEEATARFVKEGGAADQEPQSTPVRFAY